MRSSTRRKAKYLYIGRDGRDVVWSMYNHHANANDALVRGCSTTRRAASGRRSARRRPRHPRSTSSTGWSGTATRSGRSGRTSGRWWAIRDLPNVLLLHFAELKADLPGQIRRIAAFLDIPIDERRLAGDRRALQLRLHEGARDQERAAGRRLLGWRRRDLHPQGHQRPLARHPHRRRTAGATRRRRGASWAKSAPAGSPAARAHRQKMPDRITAPCGSGRPSGPPRASRPARCRD